MGTGVDVSGGLESKLARGSISIANMCRGLSLAFRRSKQISKSLGQMQQGRMLANLLRMSLRCLQGSELIAVLHNPSNKFQCRIF